MRNRVEAIHSLYRELFVQVEDEINSQLQGLSVKTAEKYLKERLAAVVSECNKMSEKCKNECRCLNCGSCCRFAVSEFSYEELKEKAANGDNFASQFVSVFVPYSSEDEYSELFPEYVELLSDAGKYYVYHCPKITEDNKCPDYENRPGICRDFPDNPIAFLPKSCGFESWKLKSEQIWLKMRAEKEIINFLLNG